MDIFGMRKVPKRLDPDLELRRNNLELRQRGAFDK